jgi:hypothetical protein
MPFKTSAAMNSGALGNPLDNLPGHDSALSVRKKGVPAGLAEEVRLPRLMFCIVCICTKSCEIS